MNNAVATDIDITPRVWIGCLACYNAGKLVGDWHEAIDADEVNTADIHGRASSHDELWCFDIENIPVRREMSPHEAAEWGRVLNEVDEQSRPALYAWVRSGDYSTEDDSDLPVVSDFVERYCGQWDSFDDYASNLAEEAGLLKGIPEEIQRHFDWKSWTGELAYDYAMCDAAAGVYVFRSC